MDQILVQAAKARGSKDAWASGLFVMVAYRLLAPGEGTGGAPANG